MSQQIKTLLIIIHYLILFGHFSSAQKEKIIFNKLTIENGLSSNIVTNMVQDIQGYIWIATAGGVNRFDGINIKKYNHSINDSTSIPDENVKCFHIDRKNQLWMGTEKGLCRYMPEFDQFTTYSFGQEVRGKRIITTIKEDKNGLLWLYYSENNSLLLFDPATEKIKFSVGASDKYDLKLSSGAFGLQCVDSQNRLWLTTSASEIYCIVYDQNKIEFAFEFKENFREDVDYKLFPKVIFEDSYNNIYITNHGLHRLIENSQTATFEYIDIFETRKPESILEFDIMDIAEDKTGNLWIGTKYFGLVKYNIKTKQIERYLSSNSKISNTIDKVNISSANDVWIWAENKYLFLYQNQTNDFVSFKHNNEDISGISEFKTSAGDIFLDNSGVTWFNTYISGLNYFNLKNARFEIYKHESDNPNSLLSNNVWGICEDSKQRIWIGANGLNIYDPRQNKYRNFNEEQNPDLKTIIGTVFSICEISPDNYFVSVGGKVVWIEYLNEKLKIKKEFLPDKSVPGSLVEWSPFCIFKDNSNDIWIGTQGGISRYRLTDRLVANNYFINYKHDPNDSNSLSDNFVWHFFEDTHNRLWICTNNSLCVLNKERTIFNRISPVINGDTIYKFSPKCIAENPEGIFWIATEGQGLIKYDEKNNRFENFTTQTVLPTNNLFSVFDDKNGHLWLSSNRGIIKFDPTTQNVENYTTADGLQGLEFIAGAFHKGSYSGKIYMGGNKGMNAFIPESIEPSNYKPSIFFTNFSLFNKPVAARQIINERVLLDKAIDFTREITLNHDENIFTVEFSSLHFSAPSKILYKYMLEGLDKDWITVDYRKAFASYSGLNPGEYQLRVKSTNSDGIWQENEQTMDIIILSPWWLSGWSYATYVFVFVVLFILLRRAVLQRYEYIKTIGIERLKSEKSVLELKNTQLEFEKQRELEDSKTRFFMNISHELRTPLTLILGPVERLIHINTDPELKNELGMIRRNANRLLQLVNQLLDLRKLETKKMNLHLIKGNILQLIKNIFDEFEYLAERNNICYELNIFQLGIKNNDSVSQFLISNPEITNCYFDADKLEKILYNLLSNAFKYTPDGGNIAITVETSHPLFLQIKVMDTGIGISSEQIPHIFDRFYRVENKSIRKQSGTGIGLALTKELVELHNGKISVESKIDECSCFTVEIPLDLQPDRPESTDEQAENHDNDYPQIIKEDFEIETAQIEKNKENLDDELPQILIVDDNPEIRYFIANSLLGKYQIIEADNGRVGLEKAHEIIPDLIISDIMMPIMDGIEFCFLVKTNEATSHIPVILLTAKSSEESQIKGLETGADDYITKPFSIDIFLLKVENAIRSRQIIREKYQVDNVLRTETKLPTHVDELFMSKVKDVIEKNLSDNDLGYEMLTKELGMSKSVLYRKIKALTNLSIHALINKIRVEKSKDLLSAGLGINEIAFQMGFSSREYFTSLFKKETGLSPSEYKKSLN